MLYERTTKVLSIALTQEQNDINNRCHLIVFSSNICYFLTQRNWIILILILNLDGKIYKGALGSIKEQHVDLKNIYYNIPNKGDRGTIRSYTGVRGTTRSYTGVRGTTRS